jgi:uncharacterized repeat protein (TIGR03803 family)
MHHRRLLTFLTLITLPCLCHTARAGALNPPVKIIYSFTNQVNPDAGVVIGRNGSFYGVSTDGGPDTNGGIFVVASNGVLITNIWLNGINGTTPLAALTPDNSGNFYGTASSGGASSNGTIFRITSGGQFQLLASFAETNGSTPMSPLLAGTNGLFYGTTFNGGSNGLGTVFSVSSAGLLSNVYSFDGTNGANPSAGLIQGINGNLYGTTSYGGANGLGTMFELTYAGALTNLCSFTNNTGAFPGGLVEDHLGNFYGPAINGGSNFAGTIFKFTTTSNLGALVTFGITNGANPNSPLILGGRDYWYGTTEEGGLHGQGTVFVITSRGILTDLVSFDGTNGARPLWGLIQTANGGLYGTTSEGGSNGFGEIFELTNIPPFIITAPQNQNWVTNAKPKFSVMAGGTVPLSYQWQFDGTNEMNDLPGQTNATLMVTNGELTTSGTYTVIVSNAYGMTSASAVLGVPQPTVAFRLPAARTRTNDLIITGTVSAFEQVPTISYWITNLNSGIFTTNSGAATLGAAIGRTDEWSITNASFLAGTNYVTVESFDTLGNQSIPVTREFFYVVPSLFALDMNGFGTALGSASVAGGVHPTNGAMLDIGEGYTLTAKPSSHYVFSNWTTSTGLISNSSTLHFIMESNLAITANFVTNNFIGAAGTYNGLFFQTNGNGVTEQTAGMLRGLLIRSNGTYSGTLLLEGTPYSLQGSFDLSGYASNLVNRTTAKGGPVAVEMTLDWTAGVLNGSASGSNAIAWDSLLQAEKSAAPSPSARYTALLAPGANAQGEIPPGDGYILITNHNGNFALSGALADGTAFNQSVPLGVFDDVPVYASLYGNKGLLLGWLSLYNGAFEAENYLVWIKPSLHSGIYTNGFGEVILVSGAPWTERPSSYFTNASLTISNAGLALDFVVSITNGTLLKEANPPSNSLTGTFYPKTGMLKIVFGDGTGKATTTGYAAFLGDSTNGGGYFLTKTNAGAITIGP